MGICKYPSCKSIEVIKQLSVIRAIAVFKSSILKCGGLINVFKSLRLRINLSSPFAFGLKKYGDRNCPLLEGRSTTAPFISKTVRALLTLFCQTY